MLVSSTKGLCWNIIDACVGITESQRLTVAEKVSKLNAKIKGSTRLLRNFINH